MSKSLTLAIPVLLTTSLGATTRYVALDGAHVSPFDSWAKAATNIQAAVDASVASDVITVSNGTYILPYTLEIDRSVTVESLAGAESTVLRGGLPAVSNRCVEMTLSATGAVLRGFTVTCGLDRWSGAGVYMSVGTVRDCIISNNTTWQYGGGVLLASGCVLDNCLIADNYAQGKGGGIYFASGGSASNCTLRGNYTLDEGSGATLDRGGLLVNSSIDDNSAQYDGGGLFLWYGGTARGCAITRNVAGTYGGGVRLYGAGGLVENCTVASNTARAGGGAYISYGEGIMRNCIINGNEALFGANWYGYPTAQQFQFCCAEPLPPGPGNIDADPDFRAPYSNDYHILPLSPCIDIGDNQGWMGGAHDMDGTERIVNGVVDMGAYEFKSGALACNYTVDHSEGFPPLQVAFQAQVSGTNTAVTYYGWDFDHDGIVDVTGSANVSNVYATCGWYNVSLTVSNAAQEVAQLVKPHLVKVGPPTVYVAINGASVFPYDSWAHAAPTLQIGIDAAAAGSSVVASNGVYAVSNHVVICKAITVTSESGPEGAVIEGGTGIRCAYLAHRDAMLSGFTLRGGNDIVYGGGALIVGGTISNCLVHDNSARYGGGLYLAYMYASTSTAVDCEMSDNSSPSPGAGGGCYMELDGILDSCIVSNNTGSIAGGVDVRGLVRRCRVVYNTANGTGYGGGLRCYRGGRIENTLIAHNSAKRGGGVQTEVGGDIVNCTVVTNSASQYGGGIYYFSRGTAINSIVQYNMAATYGSNWYGSAGVCLNCCTEPLPPGTNNIVAAPQFVDASAGDYHLAAASPCRNTGSNQLAAVPWDLDGFARIAECRVDMGAFEFINGAAIVVAPDMLDFGELLPGESRTASLHIANGGMGMLSGEVAGVQTPFTALDSAHYVIAAGTGMPMRFCFSPLWEDTYSNTVAFSGGCGAQAVLTGSAIPEPAVALALASAAIIRARRALL